MITDFLNSFVRLGIGKAFEPKFGDGRFTMVNHTTVHVKMGPQTYSSNLELSTDFQISGFKYAVATAIPKSTFYGYNKRYIDEDGVYDPLRAIDEYSKTVPGLRLNKVDLQALALTSNRSDSHEAFILNMLISWFKARLYVDTNSSNDVLRIGQSAYRDSHIEVPYFGQTGDRTIEVEMGPPYGATPLDIGFDQRDLDNYWDRPYVLKYTATNIEQVSFYLVHVFGRVGASSLNVDIPIPGIDSHDVLLDGVGGLRFSAISPDTVPWTKPEILWLWVMDYVRLNRVEQAFAAAFEMLGAIAAQPMPSYQESGLWHKSTTTLNLAAFAPVRARVPSNLTGEPNVYDLNAATITMEEGRAPQNFMAVSAVLNYTAWVGMYGLVDNYASDCSDWRSAFISRDAELAILGAVEARAALISFVTGKELITCFNANCYISYDLSAMHAVTTDEASEVFDDDYQPTIRYDGVPAYVSGSLILGAIAADVDSFTHLHSTYDFEVDRYGTASVPDALKIASTYRLFGHQTALVHEQSGEQFNVYANSADSTVAAYELLARTRPFDHIKVQDSGQRAGRHDQIPQAATLFSFGRCQVTIQTPALSVCAWKSRRTVHRPNMVIQSSRKPVVFKVSNTSDYMATKFAIRNRAQIVRQDFHEAAPDITPMIPLGGDQVAGILERELQAHEEPVATVE